MDTNEILKYSGLEAGHCFNISHLPFRWRIRIIWRLIIKGYAFFDNLTFP